MVGDGPAGSLLGLGASDPLSGISAPRKEPNTWVKLCPTALFRMTEDEMSLGHIFLVERQAATRGVMHMDMLRSGEGS